MKKFLQNVVRLKKISTIKDFGLGHFRKFPVRVRVTLFTDHVRFNCNAHVHKWESGSFRLVNRNYSAILATLQITLYALGVYIALLFTCQLY